MRGGAPTPPDHVFVSFQDLATSRAASSLDGGVAGRLVEREAELAALDLALADAGAGFGRIVVIEGARGIGRSALLEATAERASGAAFLVLRARGSAEDRSVPYGTLDACLAAAMGFDVRRSAEIDLDATGGTPAAPAGALLQRLTRRGPVALLIDDAELADRHTIELLSAFTSRLDGIRLLVVLAFTDGPASSARLVAPALAGSRATRVIAPQALSRRAVHSLIRTRWFPDAHGSFCDAVWQTTLGVPALVIELLRSWDIDGRRGDEAAAADVLHYAPDGIRRSLRALLASLTPVEREVLRALAVLDGKAGLRAIAAVAGAPLGETREALARHAARGFVDLSERPAFVHRVRQCALYEDMTRAERDAFHERAARVLVEERAPAESVAEHLLRTSPIVADWVVTVLWTAADRARRRGNSERAVALLRRTVDAASPDLRHDALFDLGRVEAACGDPNAVERLAEVATNARSRRRRAAASLSLGLALHNAGRNRDAIDAFSLGLDVGLAPSDALSRRLAMAQRATAVLAGRVIGGRGRGEDRLVARSAREAALRIVDDPSFLRSAEIDPPTLRLGVNALVVAGDLTVANRVLDAALDHASRSGYSIEAATVRTDRALVAYLQGRLADAEADASAALAAVARGWSAELPLAQALAAVVALDRRGPEAAAALLDEQLQPPEPSASIAHLHLARGVVALAEGADERAVGHFYAAGWAEGDTSPATTPTLSRWRSHAALTEWRIGDRDAAHRLALEELRLAATVGDVRWQGIASRTAALVGAPGIDEVEQLRRSVELLGEAGAQLEEARSRGSLAASLHRHNHRLDARAEYQRAIALADGCGADALAALLRRDLEGTGGRPRPRGSSADALTDRERQIAELAAAGLTNRQIAARVFVGVKAVEWHLSNVYAKLAVSSRRHLRDALTR